MTYKIDELTADTLADFNNNKALSIDFIKAVKKSPLTALNMPLADEVDALHQWKNETLKTYNYSFVGDEDQNAPAAMAMQLKQSNPTLKTLLNNALNNVSLYTVLTVGTHKIDLKLRFDAINIESGQIILFKQVYNASPFTFGNYALSEGYHIETALYLHLLKRIFKKEFTLFYVTQETHQPFNSAIYKASESMRIKGERELIELIPAAVHVNTYQTKPSYGIFSNNAGGVFELDIEQDINTNYTFNF